MSKIFIDTNIVAYAMDKNDSRKAKACRRLLSELVAGENQGVISTQVMQELFVVCTQKLGIQAFLAKGILSSLENFEVVVVEPPLIKEAIDCHLLNQISFWDSLIVVSAKSARCEKLWTEDLNHGQVIQGIRIENPLL